MNIGILGAGNMGQGLGHLWSRAGHRVGYSYRHDLKRLRRQIRDQGPDVYAGEVDEVVAKSDIVLIAVHWTRLDDVLAQSGELATKTVISCSNPMNPEDTALALGHSTSGAEELAKKIGAARFAFGFNTLPSELLHAMALQRPQVRPDVFLCGDDDDAKTTAFALARDAGLNPRDAGGLSAARYMEPFSLLVAQLAYGPGSDPQLLYRFTALSAET